MKWIELSPEKFTWEKYCSKQNVSLCDVFKNLYGPEENKLRPNVDPVGFCPANKIRIRPRPEGFVIMVVVQYDTEAVETWCHVMELPDISMRA